MSNEAILSSEKGYTIFYDGGKGYFDQLSSSIVIRLKTKYPQIKIITLKQ